MGDPREDDYQPSLRQPAEEVPEVDGIVTPAARELGVQAVRLARSEGCDCVPNVEVSPTAEPPWWSVMLLHDESCPRVQRFLGETVTGD